MKTPSANTLYYGDNLDILRQYIADQSVDLVYLDPPFNSNANYNVLFKAPGGEGSQSQIEAFEDSWHWNASAERAFDEVINSGNTDAADTGIDGYLYFKPDGKTTEKAVIEVKGGENVSPQWIRALGQVVERERAKIGVLITLTDPTTTMRREATAAGLYKPSGDQEWRTSFDRIQILTIEDLFEGKRPVVPWIDQSVFKKAKREKTETQNEMDL
jgi:hypothetical protein